jgi:hypothetical protein
MWVQVRRLRIRPDDVLDELTDMIITVGVAMTAVAGAADDISTHCGQRDRMSP